MDDIYQLTFFLALGLLAVVISIFVFAVSLLGRALEVAARSEKEKLAEIKERNVKAIMAIKEKMVEAEASGQIPKGLTQALKKLEKRDNSYEKELRQIRTAPNLLTVKGGVYKTCGFLVVALVASGVATYLSSLNDVFWIIPVSVWIIGLLATGYGIYRVCKSLSAIQKVAVTSEAIWLQRIVEAFKIAEKELDEERKPKLKLTFKDKKLPLHMKVASEVDFGARIHLTKGDKAIQLLLCFYLPEGFEFLNADRVVPTLHSKYKNHVSGVYEMTDLISPLFWSPIIKLKTPSRSGEYDAAYVLSCEGYYSDHMEFQVIVG